MLCCRFVSRQHQSFGCHRQRHCKRLCCSSGSDHIGIINAPTHSDRAARRKIALLRDAGCSVVENRAVGELHFAIVVNASAKTRGFTLRRVAVDCAACDKQQTGIENAPTIAVVAAAKNRVLRESTIGDSDGAARVVDTTALAVSIGLTCVVRQKAIRECDLAIGCVGDGGAIDRAIATKCAIGDIDSASAGVLDSTTIAAEQATTNREA